MKRVVPFIVSVTTGCTTALLAPPQTTPQMTTSPSASTQPATSPVPSTQETTGVTTTLQQPLPTPTPSASAPSAMPSPNTAPSASTKGTLVASLNVASSPVGFISYGEKKRFASYKLTASSEEDFEVQQGVFSWKNATSQNTSLNSLSISVGTQSVATFPTLDASPSAHTFSFYPKIEKNTVKILDVDGTLTDDMQRGGSNPGDKVSVTFQSMVFFAIQSNRVVIKVFAPIAGNTLTVVPFAINVSAASPSGTQTPQTGATIGIWNIISLLMSESGLVNLKSIRIGVNGSGGGPLKNVSFVNANNQSNVSATIDTLSVPSTADIPFNANMPFGKGSMESLKLRADTTSYKQVQGGAYAVLSASLIGYTLEDRTNPSKDIFIDLSGEPMIAPALIY